MLRTLEGVLPLRGGSPSSVCLRQKSTPMPIRFLLTVLTTITLCTATARCEQPRFPDSILADTSSFAADIDKALRREGDAQSATLKAIAPDLEDSSQWRFHPRGRSLLIAIPVKKNLLYAEKYGSEAAILDVIDRLTRQRDLSGRIDVVLIEPASLDCYIRSPKPRSPLGDAITPPCHCE